MTNEIEAKREAINELCEQFAVLRLDAFGSSLTPEFDPEKSDFDFLVEFKPMSDYERVEAYFGLLDALRSALGRRVDLVMAGAVKNPYIARNIEQTKQLLYAA